MCKRSTRIWSLLLVIIMIINMLPVQALALETDSVSSNSIATEDSVSTDPPFIVEEIVERRTEYIKEFRLSNGLQLATVYGYPVHYEENGEWKEIDNTLKLSNTRSGNVYTNTAGVWNVSFPQSLTENNGVSITKDGHTLNFRMTGEMHEINDNLELKESEIIVLPTVPQDVSVTEQGSASAEMTAVTPTQGTDIPTDGSITIAAPASAVTASIETIDLDDVKANAEYPETVAEKLASRLSYPNIYENTDIAFDLSSNQVKESIILEKYSDTLLGYSYELNTGGMIPVLLETGEIELRDADSEEVVMFMPAPYLIDSEGETNYDIDVSIGGKNGSYVLTYTLPQEWLADTQRTWPVVLDPIVYAECTPSNIKDQAVYTDTYLAHSRGTMMCGYRSSYGKSRIYLMYAELPDMTAADVIVSASISLYKAANSVNSCPVEVHKVPKTWTASTITWANQPTVDTTVVDYVICQNEGYYTWDITDIARGWYEGQNTGMMFKVDDASENGTTATWKQFYSSDYSKWMVPTMAIAFRNNNGLEGYWDYTTSSAGRAGTGYVNHYTGNMVWVRSDIGFGGNLMPVSISHVYNANDNAQNLFGMGYGWRTNFNQRVYHWDEDNAYGDYYIWEDSDGTDHYFLYDSANTYKDEDGLELTLKTNGSGTEKYSITDKYGNVSYFDTKGRLTKQSNNQKTPSSITITYTTTSSLLISTVTDGAGRVYQFTYTDSLLSKIAFLSKGTDELSYISFGYTDSNLTSVTDKDGKVSAYTYGSNHLLLTAQDIDGYNLTYTYTTTTAGKPNRINSISESFVDPDDSTVTIGGELAIEYAHNQTKLKDHNDNVQIVQFNNLGNTVSIQDDQGRAQYAQYAITDPATDEASTASTTETDATAKGNQLRLASKLQNTVANVLKDSSFEASTLWTITGNSVTQAIDSSAAYLGSKSLRITNSSDNAGGVYSAAFTVKGNDTYTFSAYLKTGAGTAYLSLNDGTTSVKSEPLAKNSGWTRLEVSYTNQSSETKSVTARLVTDEACTINLDCVQVEKAPTASRYNILQNGDFSYSDYAWSSNTGRTTAEAKAPANQLDANVYTLTGNPTATNRISQTVAVSGNEGDTFVLAGWAKADSVPIKDSREFGLIATFKNGTTVVNTSTVRFNDCADSTIEWQYAAAPVVAKGAYDSILIEVAYDYNANTAYFDGIQLFKEEFGNSYTYDEDGNIISVKDVQNQTTTYEYTNNDLTKQILPSGAALTYTYDDYHNVKTATSDTGIVYSFDYDDYGNNTKVSITSNGVTLASAATYSTDNNYLLSTTDAAGNTTTYDYDADTGVLKSVKYPNDTDESKTVYTYDEMYRLATAAAAIDTDTTLTASYTYENDLLTKITTGSTTYNFGYGAFSLRSDIKVGTSTLATYDYTAQNNYLSKLTYGNNNSVSYTYDDHGRLTTQTYEDGDTVTYQYDNNGALATVTDSATGVKTTYYYDFTDRLMKYAEKSTNFSHIVGYEYDSINNLTALVETINGTSYTTSYAYDDDNRVTGVTNGNVNETYAYDGFGRVSGKTTKDGATNILTETLEYIADTTNATTSGQVRKLTIDAANDLTFEYTYDANGNITQVVSGGKTTTYTYDKANQLIREDNEAANLSWTWEYDNAGNILSHSQYAYTTGELGTATSSVNYTYGDTNWGDLLTGYGSSTITSDSIGNMLSDGIWTYTWEHGRELTSLSKDGTTWTNTYNADGLRTKRTDGTTTYNYVYNGSSLSQMTVGTHLLNFAYDASGSPMAVTYDGTTYYYATNLQGDIVAILDGGGNAVVQYMYDAWGKLWETTGSMATTLGVHNPLRYRGYVYDPESSLYYLQSRYYDPQLGRFINADIYTTTGQGNIGNNMFTYCANGPVLYTDAKGSRHEAINPGELGGYGSAGGGLVIYPLIKGAETLGNALDIFDDWLEQQKKAVASKVEQSLARSKTNYSNDNTHLHHIVPQNDLRGLPAFIVIQEVFPENGVHDPRNLVQVSTRIHVRLHTDMYYALVNSTVTIAYLSAKGNAAMQEAYVTSALTGLKVFINTLELL